jgi:hypothetical protein
MRSGAATGADSSSSPTDMDCAPPYNMKQMEIPHSKRREWRCEVFKVHSRPLNLVSRYGVKPGLTSRQLLGLRSGQHTHHTKLRYDTPGAPDSPPQVRGRAWIPSVQASGGCDGPGIWSMPPYTYHTRRGQPHRAAARVRRRRKRARQSLLRRHTRRDGVRGWRRGRCTWLGPVPIDTVYGREWLLDDRAKNREACARALQADAFGNMVCPDLRPSNWHEVRPGNTISRDQI